MTDLTLTSGCVQAREQGAVLHLVLDRAAKLNAMTASMYQDLTRGCLLYTSPSPRDRTRSRMPSSA